MRDLINIVEQYLHTMTGIRGVMVEVFVNPSRKEWNQCREHDTVRAMIHGEDLLVWGVYGAVHQMVRDELKLPPSAIPLTIEGDLGGSAYIQVTDNAKTPVLHNPNIREMILENPFISKRFSDVEIGFFDEAIVGDWEDM